MVRIKSAKGCKPFFEILNLSSVKYTQDQRGEKQILCERNAVLSVRVKCLFVLTFALKTTTATDYR